MALQVNKITFWDKVIILLSAFIAVVSLVFINLCVFNGVATGVEIEYDGKPYAAYSFSELPKEKTLEIKTDIGYNIIRIVDNTVEITNSSCNDMVCCGVVIEKPNQNIVCLPNKIVVRLTGKQNVDSVSY